MGVTTAMTPQMVLAADVAPAALIIAQGGLGDGSWNDTANAGFTAGLEATGIKGRPIESKDVAAQGEEIMRRAADGGFGLVISLEWIHGEPMEKLAVDYTGYQLGDHEPDAQGRQRGLRGVRRA